MSFFDEKDKAPIKSSFFDEADLEAPEISKLESGIRGAGAGVTLGFLDELLAASGTTGAGPSTDPSEVIQKEKQLLEQYDTNLEEERAIDAAAREANPLTYGASEIAGGVLPGLVTGGGAVAANIAKVGLKQIPKEVVKGAVKEGAKLGAKYGTVAGVGYSEADDGLELAKDAALGMGVGALGGAVVPVGISSAKKLASGLSSAVKAGARKLPGGKLGEAAYKLGRQGKGISTEQLDTELVTISQEVLDNIKVKKKANDLINIKKELTELGVRVDIKGAIEETIAKLKKLKNKDFLDENNQEILTKLEKFSGVDKERKKLIERTAKNVLKKRQEAVSKVDASIISGEKTLAKKALSSKDTLETITDNVKKMDDLEIPFDTPEGQFSGTTGKFKTPEGEEYTQQVLKDTTPYQPQITETNIGGRTVINTKDLGTGKISSIIGEVKDKLAADLKNMSIEDVDYIRDNLRKIVEEGNFKDPNIREAAELIKILQSLADDAVEKAGSVDLIDRRKTFSNIFSAEDLLGIRKSMGSTAQLDEYNKVTQLAKMLSSEGNVKQRRELDLAKKLLGKEVITPEADSQLDIVNKLIPNTKVDADGNISRTGLYKQVVGSVPNVIGQGVHKVTAPISKVANKVNQLTSNQLTTFAGKLSAADNSGAQLLGTRLTEAMSKEGPAQSQAIWALSQSPAFREMVRRYTPEADKDLEQLDRDVLESISPEADTETNFRAPSSVKNIDEALENILTLEAGYQNQAADTGNFLNGKNIGTNRGITPAAYKAFYNKVPTEEDMRNLTKEQALEIYKKNYIKQPKLDLVTDPNLQAAMVDFGIASRPSRAIRYLQDILGVKVDGLMGKTTTDAIDAYEGDLLGEYLDARRGYIDEVVKNPDKAMYKKGWHNRVNEIEKMTAPDEEAEVIPEEPEVAPEEMDNSIDRVNQQQSSGEGIPMSQLDGLLENINKLKLSEEQIDELEVDATNMVGYRDGQVLKDKIRKLQGLN